MVAQADLATSTLNGNKACKPLLGFRSETAMEACLCQVFSGVWSERTWEGLGRLTSHRTEVAFSQLPRYITWNVLAIAWTKLQDIICREFLPVSNVCGDNGTL